MKIPFIKYIESLVVSKLPIDNIYDQILALGVPLSNMFPREAIQEVFNQIAKTNNKYFHELNAIPDPSWLRELDIITMTAHQLKLEIPERTLGIPGAFEILKDRNMYETMTALAMSKVNEDDVELIINGKYNIHYSHEDIKEFLHYFFNVENWSLSEKKEYMNVISDVSLKNKYELAIDGDKDYLIWKLGIAPDKSFEQMLRDMGADAYYNFKEKMKRSPDESQRWGQLMIRLSDRLDRLEKDSEEKRDMFEQITFVLSGKKEDDLIENVIDGNGQIAKNRKHRRKHISDINEENNA